MNDKEYDFENAYYGVSGFYLDQCNHVARIIAGYPNGQFGIFELPERKGLPKLDATPRLIYHNAPAAMCAKPLGYDNVRLDTLSFEEKGEIRKAVMKFLGSQNLLDSCHLQPTPYVFYADGYSRLCGRFGIDQRWFVAFCYGGSFINAEFKIYNRHPTGWTPWEMSEIYMVLNFYQISQTYRLTGHNLFKQRCRAEGYSEMQKPYGRISLYVAEALKNWKPAYTEIEFPESLRCYEPTFVPGMRYNSLPLAFFSLDEYGNEIRYVALMDDRQAFHKFTVSDFKI